MQRGLLTSASTRTEGLVSNADIAPTILAFFRLKRAANMSGHVLQVVQPRSSLTFLNRLDHEAALAHAFVYPLVKAYVGWQVLVFGFMAWLIFISRAAVQRWGRFALALDLVTLSLPLAFLFSLVLMAQQAWLTGLLTWALAALAGWLAWRLGGLRGLALVSLSTVAVLWLDALTGGLLMRHSIIGYDAVSGTRFYGIGNEYMATMLAASAVGLGFWQQAEGVVRWPFLAAGWLALVLLLGAPDTGANFGGALAAAFVLPFAVWPSIRGAAEGRAQGWRLPAAFLSVILCALVVVWLDLSRHPDLQSHIGQAARLLGHGGITAAIALLVERLTISASLFRHLPLNILGLAICLAAVAVVAVPKGRMSDLRDRFPIAWSGLVAAATAAVAVTLLNDSGVVAGGAAMTFVLGGLLGLAIHSNNEPHPGP